MSADIHFAAAVSVSEMARVGRPRAARNSFTRPTRSSSVESRLAPSATDGDSKPNNPTTASTLAATTLGNRIAPPFLATHSRCNGRVTEGCRADESDDRCALDPKRSLACPGPIRETKPLAAADRCLYLGGELGRDVGLDTDAGLLVVGSLERTASADPLHERASVVGQHGVDPPPSGGRGLGQTCAQAIEAFAAQSRYKDRRGELRGERLARCSAFLTAQPIRLVEDQQPRAMLEAERFQGRVDDTHALVEIRMRDIRDVHEENGVIQLLEGRAERGDERRWQLVDEA